MPIYEYHCPDCQKNFEATHKMSDPAPTICPLCQKGVPERVFTSSFGMQFKGEGFYVNDYKAKENPSCCTGSCSCSKKNKA